MMEYCINVYSINVLKVCHLCDNASSSSSCHIIPSVYSHRSSEWYVFFHLCARPPSQEEHTFCETQSCPWIAFLVSTIPAPHNSSAEIKANYDVSYFTIIKTMQYGNLILKHFTK